MKLSTLTRIIKEETRKVMRTHLKESSYTKVTKDMWANMSEDQQADALLSAARDPDQAESFIGSEWEALPSQITSNMHMYKAGNASIIGMHGGVNEASNIIKEGSFTDQMNPDTRKLYGEYIQNIDIFDRNAINNHQKLNDTMAKDPRVQKNSQKRLLQQALGWAITYAQQMER